MASTAGSRAEVLIEEDFTQDPKWETVGMEDTGGDISQIGWNAELKAIAQPGGKTGDGIFVRRNRWDAYLKALKTPVTDQTSFTLRGDILMTSDVPYSRVYLGLFDRSAKAGEEKNAIYIERSRNPNQHYIKLYAVDGSGERKVESKFFGLGKEAATPQTVEVQYDAAKRTLSWTVNGKSVDEVSLPADFRFSADSCGASNSRWASGSTSYTATGQVDNVFLEAPSKP